MWSPKTQNYRFQICCTFFVGVPNLLYTLPTLVPTEAAAADSATKSSHAREGQLFFHRQTAKKELVKFEEISSTFESGRKKE